MRLSVVESYPSPGVAAQGSQRIPPDPRMPNLKRPMPQAVPAKAKRRVRLVPAEGWLALVLLSVAVYSVVYAIMAANWVEHTSILWWSTGCGLLVGFAVAKTRQIPQAILHLVACLIGHWLSIWLTCVAFHVSWLLVLGSLRSAITNSVTNPMTTSSEMVFLFYLSFLCFFLGYFGTWLIYRARLPWLVAFVYCSIMLVNLNYVKQDLALVVAILLAALMLLVARIQLVNQLAQWTSEGLHTDHPRIRNITQRVMGFAALLAILALLLSWLLPIQAQPSAGATFWDQLNNAMTNISHGHLPLQDPGSILLPYQPASNFFGDQLTITGTVNLPSGDVLYYTSSAAPQYLEGFTYDHFDGHTWTTIVGSTNQNYDAHVPISPDTLSTTSPPVTTDVTVVQPPENVKHYIFAPAHPGSFDVPVTVYGNGIISAWAQQSPLYKGEHYQVTSNLPLADAQNLEATPLPANSQDYWKSDPLYATLQSYYLSVPDDLSPAVVQTARQWTAGTNNTYDALKRLEAHLSNPAQFTYSLSNAPIPSNVDVVDWLLQTRRGYCTYYASAMTIMARLLHIPTRIVNGFSQGQYDAQRKLWVIGGTDAHSWVQAYFPGSGWINFEPTPGYSMNAPTHTQPTVTPVSTQSSSHPGAVPTPKSTVPAVHPTSHTSNGIDPIVASTIADNTPPPVLLVGVSVASLLAALLFLAFALFLYWWRRLYPNSTFISGKYWLLCRVASWAGLSPRTWQTPYEYSATLGSQLPGEARSLWHLTELFVRERWAAPHESPHHVEQAQMPNLRRIVLHLFIRKIRKS